MAQRQKKKREKRIPIHLGGQFATLEANVVIINIIVLMKSTL
jgi:hypothetical protein